MELSEDTLTPEKNDASNLAEEDLLRANGYGLLASLLIAPPSGEVLNIVKAMNGDASPFGQAITELGELARTTTKTDIEDEFTRLFYGHGAGGELHPYASFYLTGFVYDKPLSDLREDLARLGLSRADGISEPEDQIGFLMNAMHDLITGAHGRFMDIEGQKAFFDHHVAPWASRFFKDLEGAENAVFYRPVGIIGQVLMEIESKAFTMAA
ncbi:molecular chaperone TorD family protein [Magnetovibrio sp.]|uniref:TorD/DmsD family molecular chaperone n=1 Tax=Magnetovibrio sp. TaxID=2024836 RepID=UPI002F931101